ncbi:GNAT family N-acetyltransferase [Aeromonas sobria]|uniref:GNAT family N-acetyltransferase n=1 Tax=Aeromonas sobria TaxID=646 RepID=A0A1S2CRZ3_AERSO|nr:GNAT family N-acetyltransferase [Aeromonas sobria]MBS4686286.1 GNAT family N-acetyltransferase [Aeromonas sobria]OHY90757.1 GNAT family N-acetyltransferase [Aeromonas sobria]
MELLIEATLWQPQWAALLRHWQQQGHRWQLLLGKEAAAALDQSNASWASCPPDGVLCPGALLAAWLDGDLLADFHADPSRQILISASTSLLTLAKEQGLLTLGPVGADLPLTADADLGAVLNRLLARRVMIPMLAEDSHAAGVVLRPLQAADDREIVRYCSDEALARYTLNIPHPYPPEGARDWLALSWRKAALGLGWSWAITLPEEGGAALVGVISLHWNGELAWWVGVPWQNRGLATRAAGLVKAFAFDQLQLPALTARHMPDNLASGRVMAKLGMHYRGRRHISGRQPCEVSYWRLDRPLSLPAPLLDEVTRWLEDERIAVVILRDPATANRQSANGKLAISLFVDETGTGQDPCRLLCPPHLEGRLDLHCYPVALLEQAEPDQLPHLGDVLLKDRDEQGLAWLLQLAALQRQGPDLLSREERASRLHWFNQLMAQALGGHGDSPQMRYQQLRLLVELPELADELDGCWHQAPELTFERLVREAPALWLAYREVMNRVTPATLRALQQQFAARFPECTLPFLDKGTQNDQQLCGIMPALLYEE